MGFDGSLRQNTRPRQSNPPAAGALYMQPPLIISRQPPPHSLSYQQHIAQTGVVGTMQISSSIPYQQSPSTPQPQQTIYDSFPVEEIQNGMEIVEEEKPREPGLAERVSGLRANGIGFDVKFVVSTSPAVEVKAHRIVMAAGSKLLADLMYSERSLSPSHKKRKGANTLHADDAMLVLEYPDIDKDAFQTLIDYLYSDFQTTSINVNESALLNTLYAAKKFDIAELENICVQLLGDLSPSRAVSLLEQAIRFDSTDLLNRCYQMIDERSDEALAADAFLNLEKSMMKSIVVRNELSPSDELSVFKALCNWAEVECKRQGIEVTPKNKRDLLSDVFNDVRFPTMTVEEFGEAANSGLLSDEEIGILFRYITATVRKTLTLPFLTQERRIIGRSKFVVRRFMSLSKNSCKKQKSNLWFIVNREILVTAIGVYGLIHNESNAEGNDWETTVEIEIASSNSSIGIVEHSMVTIQGTYGDGRVYIARFKKPARVLPNIPYRATLVLQPELETFAGGNGTEDMRVYVGSASSGADMMSGRNSPNSDQSSVTFAFHNDDPTGVRRGMTRGPAVFANAIGGFYNRSTKGAPPMHSEGCLYEGQIPEIHFLVPTDVKKEVDV